MMLGAIPPAYPVQMGWVVTLKPTALFKPLTTDKTKQIGAAFPFGDFRTVGMSVFQAAVLTINLSF